MKGTKEMIEQYANVFKIVETYKPWCSKGTRAFINAYLNGLNLPWSMTPCLELKEEMLEALGEFGKALEDTLEAS
jgi:hypothetical protein